MDSADLWWALIAGDHSKLFIPRTPVAMVIWHVEGSTLSALLVFTATKEIEMRKKEREREIIKHLYNYRKYEISPGKKSYVDIFIILFFLKH